MLECKPELEKSLARFEAWWVGDLVDRPPVNVSVPAGKELRWPEKTHATQRERWLDMEHRLAGHELWVESRIWTADSMPIVYGQLGPEFLATLFGAELEFTADTSFARPILSSVREIHSRKPDFGSEYWQWMRRFMEASAERGAGRWLTALPDLHTHADLLASLREPQKLLIDLVEDFEGVKLAAMQLARLWDALYEPLACPLLSAGQPISSWLLAPHRGRACTVQADFSAMVAPEMFAAAFLSGIEYEVSRLERSIFHMHGERALQHLDAILQVPRLNAVQWMYGAGNGPARRWIDVYKRIQAAGKGLHILCETFEDAISVAEHLKPQGCYFEVAADYTVDQVNAFLARLERWSAGGAL
jgi:hypothetical protein